MSTVFHHSKLYTYTDCKRKTRTKGHNMVHLFKGRSGHRQMTSNHVTILNEVDVCQKKHQSSHPLRSITLWRRSADTQETNEYQTFRLSVSHPFFGKITSNQTLIVSRSPSNSNATELHPNRKLRKRLVFSKFEPQK